MATKDCGHPEQPDVVAAIDLGTAFSGYAYSYRTDFLTDPLKIKTSEWTKGTTQNVSLKTSSCILFDPDKNFANFGYEAEERYAELEEDDDHHDWYFFRRMKMLLYKTQDLSLKTPLKDVKELQGFTALTVFKESIRYLKDQLLKSLNEDEHKGKRKLKIRWILTVPAIWNDAAKQFMREAANQAGIPNDDLVLALEPEAASLFCKHLPLNDSMRKGTVTCFLPDTRYLVLDAGGGTVDITVHETHENGLRELHKANGGPWGGISIDKAFLEFLFDIFTKDAIEVFAKDHRMDYMDFLKGFENLKRTLKPESENKLSFTIPHDLLESYKMVCDEDFSLESRADLQGEVTFNKDNNKLHVAAQRLRDLMTGTCSTICEHLQTILSPGKLPNTNIILMVGGFSECSILQHAIREAFPAVQVVIPAESGLAVLKGAVIYGHNPGAIISRVSKFSYGLKSYQNFRPGFHPDYKKVVMDDIEKCKDCFDQHIEEGQEVFPGKHFVEKEYHPPRKSDNVICAKVYCSTHRNPMYVDEVGCTYLGQLAVDVSDIPSLNDRGVRVKMIYGDTELKVQAKLVTSGKVLNAKFDFLQP